ncbi:MAG: protein kinase domain-containing protein [Blastocatellia bacterium]
MSGNDEKVAELFAAAISLEADERDAFLVRECAGEPHLLAEVRALLAADREVEVAGFMHEPALKAQARQVARDLEDASRTGEHVGHYEILSLIGEGGMGEVYLARDLEFDRKVALKLVKGGLRTKAILRRFLSERQILASLDHPNIARLLDGGTSADGLPYFVMEYIEGQPITDYAEARALSTSARLDLFRKVCSGVQYAHQNLVIHRDIKPSNILVTDDGTPKLLDFGIAKLFDPAQTGEAVEATATLLRVMTPEYASPEQVNGAAITTASDVYSLGVLLYELLTGRRPHRLKSHKAEDVAQAICETEPERPSQTISRAEVAAGDPTTVSAAQRRRQLRGDLDNIILMALRKEPQRRYPSVGELAEDLRRHLEGLPVRARKDTLGYRAAKFIKRNRWGVAAAALILITLLGGIVTTMRQRARAERRFNDVRKLAHSVLFDYHDAIADLPGSTPVRERLVKDALQYLDSLAGEAGSDASLQSELAAAYRKIGDVQGNPYFANLGDRQGAAASYRKSLAIRQALAAAHPQNGAMRQDVADSLGGLGDVLWEMGDIKGGYECYRQAVEILEPLNASAPDDLDLRRALARAYAQVGDIKGHPYFPNLGDTSGGLESHRRALALRESLVAADPNNVEYRRALYQSCYSMGYMLRGTGDLAEAEQSLRRAVEIIQSLAAADPNNAKSKRSVTVPLTLLGDVLRDQGKNAEALGCYRQAKAINEAIRAADPTNAQARRDLGINYERIAKLLVMMGDFAEAVEMSRQVLASDEAAFAAHPNDRTAQNDVAVDYDTHGDILLRSGDVAAALENYRKGLAMREDYARQHADDLNVLPGLEDSYERLGDSEARMGDALAALASYRKARECGEKFLAADPQRDRIRDSLATICYKLGKEAALVASSARTPTGRRSDGWGEARSAYQHSLELFNELRQRGALRAEDASKPDEAARELARCDTALAKLSGSSR